MVDTAQYREVRIPAKYSRGTRRPGSSPSWHGNFAEKRTWREEDVETKRTGRRRRGEEDGEKRMGRRRGREEEDGEKKTGVNNYSLECQSQVSFSHSHFTFTLHTSG